MHQGMLNYFDKADNAFISAYRKHHPDGSFEISVEYLSCPDLNNRILIIADPMLATGASLVETIQAITKTQKPKEIHIAVAIASKKGIETVQAALGMDTSSWCGDIDDVVLLFTNQATCDRRVDRNQIIFNICFIIANDFVGHFFL